MNIEQLRKLAGREEIDYPFLMSALSNYAWPREKISNWLKSGELIRVKKGLYVFGSDVARSPYSKELLANLIYGPSAISLQYALSYYGLIPERVSVVTSITPKRRKVFDSPVGRFTYQYLETKKYAMGITSVAIDREQKILMASLEKALCDHLHLNDKKIKFSQLSDVEAYLFSDLRADQDVLGSIKLKNLLALSHLYRDDRLLWLHNFIKQWKTA